MEAGTNKQISVWMMDRWREILLVAMGTCFFGALAWASLSDKPKDVRSDLRKLRNEVQGLHDKVDNLSEEMAEQRNH